MRGHISEFFRDKVVFITGASSGIGAALARQLGQRGAKLTLTARRLELLEEIAQRIIASGGPAPLVMEADVTSNEGLQRVVAESMRHWGRLDVVIANAGFGVVGPLRKLSLDDYRRQFETNVFGVLRTIYAALPEIEKANGAVVIIGSVAGWVATAGSSAYAMSKFALRALANAITPELRRAGVTVTLVSPGFIESNIRRVDNQGTLHRVAKDPVPAWIQMSADRAADHILTAVARGKREVIVTGHGKLLIGLERFAPWVTRWIGRRAAGSEGYRAEPKEG